MKRLFSRLSFLYDKRSPIIFGAAAFILSLFVLFGGRTIGLSNNGDFARVMHASSLKFGESNPAFTFQDRYEIELTKPRLLQNAVTILFGDEGYSGYPSLQIPVVRASVVLNLLYNRLAGGPLTTYRIEMLGLMYVAMYALAIGFLTAQFTLKKRWLDFISKGLLLVVLCDAGYLTYFNSFYGEALQIILFVMLAALLLRVLLHPPRIADALITAIAAIAFGWSKFFNIPAACLFAVLIEDFIFLKTKKKAALFTGAATVAVLVVIYVSIPPWMNLQTKYNTIFFGILRETDAATSAEYLGELGLPEELARYRNTNYYVDGVAAAIETGGYENAVESVSDLQLCTFYIKHPGLLLRQTHISVLNAGSIRPVYLSNFDETAPKLTFSHRFSLWSDTRIVLGFDTWLGFIGTAAVFALTLIRLMKKQYTRFAITALLLGLAGIAAYFFFIPVISNGEGDLAKHLFALAHMADLMVLTVLIAALYELSCRKVGLYSVGALVLATCLTAAPVSLAARQLMSLHRTHSKVAPGAYVSFGVYDGDGLIWQVIETDGETATLVSVKSLGSASFSATGSSLWETSSLRSWLNADFLNSFSPKERAQLLTSDTTVLLSRGMRASAISGSYDFYFSHIPVLASRDYANAYQTIVQDTVSLPTIEQITALDQDRRRITLHESYWLQTPYFNNDYMTRIVLPNGFILMREVTEQAGIRPVIYINLSDSISGSGSLRKPFELG